MPRQVRKLVTIIAEAALEGMLVEDVERLGAHGYTVTEARGKGSRGVRAGSWDASSNIRVEIVCDDRTADAIINHVEQTYYRDFAMILFVSAVDVLRPDKF